MTGATRDDDLQRWLAQFDAKLQTFKQLCTEVDAELRKAITVADPDEDAAYATQLFKVHDLRSRVKKRKSFRDKILERRHSDKRYSDPLNQMRDIVGARVVCLFLDDLPKIEEIVREKFDVKKREDKTEEAGPEKFGYRAVHYDCKIKPGYKGPHYDAIKGIWFEIQVRTILQDAWAVVEHILGYKGLHSIPDESRADFSALVGLFHLADKTFQQIRDSAEQQDVNARTAVAEVTGGQDITVSPTPAEIEDMGLNRSVVKALLRQLYADREPSPDSQYSQFVEELAAVGVTAVKQLQALLIDGHEDALRSEAANPPEDDEGSPSVYTDVGLAREAVDLSIPEFFDYRVGRVLGKNKE